MLTQLELEPFRADICGLSESVFRSMLRIEVHPSDAELLGDSELITGAVYFAGAWKGAVLLQCNRSQACEFTARLMGIPTPESFDDDVCDAVGEVANIIGGNLKPILPHGIALSMPSVVEGYPSALRICCSSPIIRLAFESTIGVFWLTIIGLVD
jgi:CheY-specific phosphatase CheX